MAIEGDSQVVQLCAAGMAVDGDPDVWDIAAGAIGAVLAAPVVWWRAKRTT